MLDKPWAYGIDPNKNLLYQPVAEFTYWPVLGPFNNWDTIQFTNKTTPSEFFDEVHKVVLDDISSNISYLLQLVKYGTICHTP